MACGVITVGTVSDTSGALSLLTAEQLRAARAVLRWDQVAVAERAGVSVETIKRLERMDGPLRSTKAGTLDAIEKAFEAAGVIFIPEDGEGPGLRLRKARPTQQERRG